LLDRAPDNVGCATESIMRAPTIKIVRCDPPSDRVDLGKRVPKFTRKSVVHLMLP